MIIGNGLIGKNIVEYDRADILFFASGVSNSQEVRHEAFERETALVVKYLTENANKLFVYFSTYSINDPSMQQKAYISHKIAIEQLIAATANRYLIIRTSNLMGQTDNPYIIGNYLYQKVATGEPFECWNVQRNLLDIKHLCAMAHRVIETETLNKTIFLINPLSYSVLEIVVCLETILKKKANYTVVEKDITFNIDAASNIDTTLSIKLFDDLFIPTENYLQTLFLKYSAL
jgi:dTDP-4-dehydrorhamnose reductase